MKIVALTLSSMTLALVMQAASARGPSDLIGEVAQEEMLAAKANNDDFLKREILYFAKRHRFVTVNEEVLEDADRFTIQLFDDVVLTVEKREFQRTPVLNVWRGVIVDPVSSTEIRAFPSGELLDKETAREVHERRHSMQIYAHVLPSSVTGPSTVGRSIRLGVYVPALRKTFIVKSLEHDPLVHVVYEQDPDRCCFATLDTPLDPDDPNDAARIEKGRAYQRYIDSLDIEVRQRERSSETTLPGRKKADDEF